MAAPPVASKGIIYSLIARDTVVLVEYASASGNFMTVSRIILEKIPSKVDAKRSYEYGEYMFHFMVHQGVTYLCMSEFQFARRICFTFLEDIKNRFLATYGTPQIQSAVAYAMNSGFSNTLIQQMNYYSYDPSADRITEAKMQIESTKSIMVENIDKIIERGQKIDILVDDTEKLQHSSKVFQGSAKKLRCAMWKQNMKWYIIGSVTLVVLVWLLLSFICGFDFSKC